MIEQEDLNIELRKIGVRIRQLRKHRKMTQVDLEISTGISHADISRIENGLQNAEIITYIKIAYGLNVPTQDLYNYDGEFPE